MCWLAPEMPTVMIKFRRHRDAGQADLPMAGNPAGVYRGARGANRSLQHAGQFFQIAEGFRPAQPAAPGYDDAGLGQADTGMLMPDAPHHPHARLRGVEVDRHGHDVTVPIRARRQRLVRLRTQNRYLRGGSTPHTSQKIAAVHWTQRRQAPTAGIDAHFQAILQQPDTQPARQARGQLTRPRPNGQTG